MKATAFTQFLAELDMIRLKIVEALIQQSLILLPCFFVLSLPFKDIKKCIFLEQTLG